MPKKLIDSSKPETVLAFVREFLTEQKSAYMGMIDKVPESLKTQVTAFKDKVDSALTVIASIPAGQTPEASEALNHVASAMYCMQENYAGTMDAMGKAIAELTPKATELQALQGRIEKKELLESTEVETRCTEAADKARKEERDRARLLGERRSILAKADIPLPLADETIDGDDKAFTGVQTKATERTKKLKDLGQFTQLNAEDLSKLIYGPDETFNFAIKIAEGSKKSAPAPDPMLGGRTEGKQRRTLCIA